MARTKKFQGNENSGRKPYQSMKPYLIYKYLLQQSDEDNVKSAADIAFQLKDIYGISTTSRTVFKDVETMNQALLIANEKANDVEEAIELCLKEKNHTIVYDTSRRGFYIPKRREKINDLYTILDCIYAAPFLDKDITNHLADMVCSEFVSEDEKKEILDSTYVPSNGVSDCTPLLKKLNTLRLALEKRVYGKAHIPDEISFEYSEYQIEDAISKTGRSHKSSFTIDPYKLFIYKGNHYLFGYNNEEKEFKIFSVNQMEKIKRSKANRYSRSHTDSLQNMIDRYVEAHLSETDYAKYKERVTLQFDKSLLGAVVDKFGVLDAVYTKVDSKHYSVTVPVNINSQFFGWICGFDKDIKILEPIHIKSEYFLHLRRKLKKL